MKSEGFRRHLTYSNVMATIAVFLVLGGGAWAATKLPNNSVGTKQLKKNAVTTAKLKNGAVTSSKVKKGSLLASNFKAGELPKGATGPAGPTGPAGVTGASGVSGAAAVTVAAQGGGEDPPSLFGPTTSFVMASTPITLTKASDIVMLGSMGDKQVECSVDGCQGLTLTNSTIVGLYLEYPNTTGPTPVPGGGISVEGSAFNRIQIPPLSGMIRDVPPGDYTAKLILASLGVTTSPFNNGGAEPWITALASNSN